MDMLDDKGLREKGWQDMLSRLDEEMPEKKAIVWWKRYGLLLLFMILFSAGIGYFLQTNQYDRSSSEKTGIVAEMNSVLPNSTEENIVIHAAKNENIIIDVDKNLEHAKNEELVVAEAIVPSEPRKVDKVLHNADIIYNHTTVDYVAVKLNSADQGIQEPKVTTHNKKASSQLNEKNEKNAEATKLKIALFSTGKIATIEEFALETSMKNQLRITPFTANAIIMPREVRYYGFLQTNMYPELNSASSEIGLKVEVGSKGSPWSLSSGVSYEYVQFDTKNIVEQLSSSTDDERDTFESITSNAIGSIQDELRSASFINIPIMFHYRINRFNIGVGLNNAILINSEINLPNLFVENNGLHSYRAGINQSMEFMVHPKWTIGLHGSWDITGLRETIGKKEKLNKIGLRLAYKF